MAETIRIEHIHDYFDRFSGLMKGRSHTDEDERRIELPPRLGAGTIVRLPIRDGMEIVISDLVLERDLKLHIEAAYSLFELNYCLDGEIYCAWGGKEHTTGSRSGNVFHMDRTKLYMEKKGGVRTRTLEVRWSPAKLLRYVDGTSDFPAMQSLLSRHQGLGRYANSPQIQQCVHDLFHCTRRSAMRRLYAESKAMELIALIAGDGESERPAEREKTLSMNADDQARLDAARELVLLHVEQPLSIRELARQAGMNEYKLKKGFRDRFGVTIFELVRKRRMEMALQLMEKEGRNVGETASELGYSNMSNFTSAFRKQYGVNPGQYIRQMNRS
ncbi:helix-turn-helix transcriptional regulator [Paenibacillus hodogayensis]|uniref:Helix-turn-helix transcriptional regulator n=1 Tax=Paenibacillus hodogayensis TaxID=279208 RepID=A0ABV5W2L3_9BACL